MKTLLASLLFLSGCITYSHPTKTEAEFRKDHYECLRDTALVRDEMHALRMRIMCMETKGWSL